MSDVSDAAKHVVLGEPVRQNSIFVAAMFEVNLEGHFRFLRNGVFIEHASLGRHDFMSTALSAIEYLYRKRTLNLAWSGEVREASIDFFQRLSCTLIRSTASTCPAHGSCVFAAMTLAICSNLIQKKFASRCGSLVKNKSNMALNLAPFGRWTLRDKAAQRRLALRSASQEM